MWLMEGRDGRRCQAARFQLPAKLRDDVPPARRSRTHQGLGEDLLDARRLPGAHRFGRHFAWPNVNHGSYTYVDSWTLVCA